MLSKEAIMEQLWICSRALYVDGSVETVIQSKHFEMTAEKILSLVQPKDDTPPQLHKHDVMRWVDTNVQMPDFDGMYLAFIYQKQLCGTVWKYQKVVHNRMNAWVLDESEELKYWSELPPPPIV